jgi:hypothetical protein
MRVPGVRLPPTKNKAARAFPVQPFPVLLSRVPEPYTADPRARLFAEACGLRLCRIGREDSDLRPDQL